MSAVSDKYENICLQLMFDVEDGYIMERAVLFIFI